MSDVKVGRALTIPSAEIQLSFSTSGGPGGQHANKVATRAELAWNVEASAVLGPRQRDRIKRKLARRIDTHGTLRLTSDRFRSQLRNREDVLQRLAALVGEALKPEKPRVATAPTPAARERRLHQKKRRSEIKRARRITLD